MANKRTFAQAQLILFVKPIISTGIVVMDGAISAKW